MANFKEQSFIMAQRLKNFRENMGLSHEKLSKALTEKYGISISSDSLMNYEIDHENHTKAYKNQGMRVEYLRCLADFYNVSADYLLGLTEVKCTNPDVRKITNYTGLTEKNILFLNDPPGLLGDDSPLNYFREAFYTLVNDILESCQNHVVYTPFWQIQQLRSSFNEKTARSSVDIVTEAIARERGFAVLSVNDSIAFYSTQLANAINQSIIEKYSIEETSEPYGRKETMEVNGKPVDVWCE